MPAAPKPVTNVDSDASDQTREALAASQHVSKAVVAVRNVAANLRAYPGEHPSHKRVAQQAVQGIRDAFKAVQDIEVEITATGVSYHTVPLYDVAELVRELADICRRKKIGRIAFKPGIGEEEVFHFVQVLWGSDKTDAECEAIAEQLQKKGVTHFHLFRSEFEEEQLEKLEEQDESAPRERSEPRIADLRLLYKALVEALKDLTNQAAAGGRVETLGLDTFALDVALHLKKDPLRLLPLAAVRRFDRYEYMHPVNVCLLASSVIAAAIGHVREMREFVKSALLVDIGLALGGAGRATATDPAGHDHPVAGSAALDGIDGLPKVAMVAAFEHHLGADFGGYPRTDARWRQSFLTRVIHAAERYDALTTSRPSVEALCPEAALRAMAAESGKTLDRTAFEALVTVLGPFPPGSPVELNTGEVAVVLGRRASASNMAARVITDRERRVLPKPASCAVGLPGNRQAVRRIQRPLDANRLPIRIIDYL